MVFRQRDKLLFQVQPEMFTTLWCSLLTRVFHRHRNSMGVDQMDIGQWRCTSFYIWCILIPQSSCLQKTAKVILRPLRPSDFLLKSLWRSSKNNIWIGWDGMIILEGSNEHQRCSSQLAVLSQVASKGTMQGLCVVVPPRWYQLCDSLRDRRQITFDAIIIPSMICKVVFRKWQQTSCPSFLKPTWTRSWERYSSTWILSASEAAGVVSSGILFDISLEHGIRDWRSHNWAKKEAW